MPVLHPWKREFDVTDMELPHSFSALLNAPDSFHHDDVLAAAMAVPVGARARTPVPASKGLTMG